MFIDKAKELLDEAAELFDLDTGDTEKALELLSGAVATVELSKAFYEAYKRIKDTLEDPDMSGAERTAMLAETRKSILALKAL